MKSHSHMLSKPCIDALGASGEMRKESTVREYKREMHGVKTHTKASLPVGSSMAR